jgi:sigma-B regulation protein RsbU (phosphoserine phosphatase)
VLRHASGAIKRLEVGGLPLGISSAVSYQFGSATLAAGDLLLIFTDGLVDAEDDGEREYGEERMLPVIQTIHSGTAKEALERALHPLGKRSRDHTPGVARSRRFVESTSRSCGSTSLR